MKSVTQRLRKEDRDVEARLAYRTGTYGGKEKQTSNTSDFYGS